MSIKVCPNGHQYLAEKHSTCPYCSRSELMNEDEKTQIVWDESEYSEEPLLGWIVCIEGTDMGTDFPLRGAITSIGRGSRVKISLNDQTISRNGPVLSVAYDRIGNKFFLVKGDASSNVLAYLNGKLLTQSMELKPYDRILLAESKLLFVPFCGDRFTWDKNDGKESER